MADRIEGIAVLDETQVPARLTFCCVREDGGRAPWVDAIPVREGGSPEVPERTTWEFTVVEGGWLDVHPSVKMSYVADYTADVPPQPIWREFFHNEGQWRVRFERWDGGPRQNDEVYDRVRELNGALLDPPAPVPVAVPEARAAVTPRAPVVAPPPTADPRHRWRSNRGFQVRPKR